MMPGTITLTITIDDSILMPSGIVHKGFSWIKPGELWNDYEPGYISNKNHLIWKRDFYDFINDCLNGLISNMTVDYESLKCELLNINTDKISIWINYKLEIPNSETLCILPDDIKRLSRIGSAVTISPTVDYFITDSDDGKNIIAKMESIICPITKQL